jgi:hypothetical protein
MINTRHLTQYNKRVHKDLLRDLDAILAAATFEARTAATAVPPWHSTILLFTPC